MPGARRPPVGRMRAMTPSARDLISRATRSEFRTLMTIVPCGAISDAFSDEDFSPAEEITYDDTSVRRTRTEQFLRAVDWSSAEEVSRALRAMERLLGKYLREEWAHPSYLEPLKRELLNDGYRLSDQGRIKSVGPGLPDG